MKILLRNTAINAFALSLLPGLLGGVTIVGGLPTLFIAGLIFGFMYTFVRPILHVFTLPLNFLTFGMFSFVINMIILYFLTVLVPQITISSFTFKGFSYLGFVIPQIHLNTFFAYFIASLILSAIVWGVKWLMAK